MFLLPPSLSLSKQNTYKDITHIDYLITGKYPKSDVMLPET